MSAQNLIGRETRRMKQRFQRVFKGGGTLVGTGYSFKKGPSELVIVRRF